MIESKNFKNKKEEIILKRFQRSLTAEGSTIIAFAGYGLVGYALLFTGLTIMALIYSIYLVKTLYFLGKKMWLITFFIMVGTPLILKFILAGNLTIAVVFSNISLFMFYLFCWILKFSVSNWLEDIKYANINFDE